MKQGAKKPSAKKPAAKKPSAKKPAAKKPSATQPGGNHDMWLVECARCAKPKAPRGCVPVKAAEAKDYCMRDCPGYEEWPQPSRLPEEKPAQ